MDAAAYKMCFDEDQLATLCAQYDRRIDSLGAENAKLRTQLADAIESIGRMEERCAKLRKRTCYNASFRLDESRFHCSECGFGCWVKDVADGHDKLPRFCPNCGREVVDE